MSDEVGLIRASTLERAADEIERLRRDLERERLARREVDRALRDALARSAQLERRLKEWSPSVDVDVGDGEDEGE